MKTHSRVAARFEELEKTADEFEADGFDHKKFHQWSVSALGLIRLVFGEDSPHHQILEEGIGQIRSLGPYDEYLYVTFGAFSGAKEDYEGGHLSRVRSLVVAEAGDDVLEQAEDLLSNGYKDPACILARVSLELALKDLCDREHIGHDKRDKMNAELARAELYNKSMQKQITAWAGKGNDAAHGNWDQYTNDDVKDMIGGVRRFIAEHL